MGAPGAPYWSSLLKDSLFVTLFCCSFSFLVMSVIACVGARGSVATYPPGSQAFKTHTALHAQQDRPLGSCARRVQLPATKADNVVMMRMHASCATQSGLSSDVRAAEEPPGDRNPDLQGEA